MLPFLNIQQTFAVFHSIDICPSAKYLFIKKHMGFAIDTANSFKTFGCSPSRPADLLAFKRFNLFKDAVQIRKFAHNGLICFFQHNYIPTFEQ